MQWRINWRLKAILPVLVVLVNVDGTGIALRAHPLRRQQRSGSSRRKRFQKLPAGDHPGLMPPERLVPPYGRISIFHSQTSLFQ